MKVHVAAILIFSFKFTNIYFWSSKLLQLNHIIVNVVRGILIVTVNTYKKRKILYLKVKQRLLLSKTLHEKKKLYKKILQKP